MIPEGIHFYGFGGRPLPPEARLYLASWRYHLPNYELILWDRRSFDPASHHSMEVDVEVLARFDKLLDSALLIGLEDRQRFATSIIGIEAGH